MEVKFKIPMYDPWKLLILIVFLVSIVNFYYTYSLYNVINSGGSTPTGTQTQTIPPTQSPTQPTVVDVSKIDLSKAHIEGSASAKVTIIEYSDFQCPYCGSFVAQTLPQITTDYINTGKVRLVFRQFPLSFHQYAEKAAEASECAGDQNKFWEMHSKLFANQQALDDVSLKKYATDLGLDATKFNSCLDSGTKKSLVQAEEQEGTGLGVSGTPSFFINGQAVVGALPYSEFKTAIDQALAS